MNYELKDPALLLRTWKNRPLQKFAEELYTLLVGARADETAAQVFTPPPDPIQPRREIEGIRTRSITDTGTEAIQAARRAIEAERPPPHPPATVVTQVAEPTPQPRRPVPVPAPTAAAAPARPAPEVVRPREAPILTPVRPPERPALLAGAGALGVPPLSDSRRKGFTPEQPLLDIGDWAYPEPDTGGTNVFLGKVNSGSGNSYQVYLYRSGPQGNPDDQPVTVTIPQIDANEQIPQGTWFCGILQMTDADGNTLFVYQPAVWLQ